MRKSVSSLFLGAVLALAAVAGCAPVADVAEETGDPQHLVGRWNMTVQGPDTRYPSWVEITRQDGEFQGRFVGRVGSARPIEQLEIVGHRLNFSLPVQYEPHPEPLTFSGDLVGDRLEGTTNAEDGSILNWTAIRAPALPAIDNPQWGEPVQLFNGRDLTGWKVRDPNAPNNWKAQDGVLVNTERGTDLMTDENFGNFKLSLEFMYPEGSNSGIYLRGRYEVQIQDDYGKEPHNLYIGGVYGFLTPTVNAARKAGEWQSYEITLLGRWVTVVLNDVTVIDNQEIPGITGGALDGDEGLPGPILLQGDHGPVSFRNIVLTPVTGGEGG